MATRDRRVGSRLPQERLAWERLIPDRARRILLHLAREKVPRGEDPACVVNQAILDLYVAIDRGKKVRKPLAYSRRTVRNGCYKLRQERRIRRVELRADMDHFQSSEIAPDIAEAPGRRYRLRDLPDLRDFLLRWLSPREQQIVHGLAAGVADMTELGELIGQTRRVVRERYYRLIRKLEANRGILADFVPRNSR